MPDDTQPRTQSPAGLRPSFERIAGWLDSLRKVVVALAVTAAAIIVVAAIVRELSIGGIVIEPGRRESRGCSRCADARACGPTDRASISTRIQSAGAQEWQKLHVDEDTHRIDLQIPGSPLRLGGTAREIVELFGSDADDSALRSDAAAAACRLFGDDGDCGRSGIDREMPAGRRHTRSTPSSNASRSRR